MKVRGVRRDRRGAKWVAAISDPFQHRQRRFHFDSEDEAIAKKLDIVAKIKAVQAGRMTVPTSVEDIVLWLVKDGKEGLFKGAAAEKPATIAELIAAYLERQRGRIGAEEGGISCKHFQSDVYQLRLFREFCEESKKLRVEDAIHPDTLERYKAHAAKHYKSKVSLSHATYAVKALITWAWETHRISDMPRNLSSFRKVVLPAPVAKTYTKEEFTILVNNATARMRLYLILAANTGYTQQAIADLRHDVIDWETGIIDQIRTKVQKKAEVPQKSKLWPSTLKLLKMFATDPSENDLVILSEDGNPVVWQRLPDGSDNLQVVDSVQRGFHRLKTKCKITGGMSFKHIRKMGADLIKNKYPGAKTKTNSELFDMYLAHKPHKMVMHYDPGDWTELYQATDWMGKFLDLFDGGSLEGSG